MASTEMEQERDAGFDAPVVIASLVPLLLVLVWIGFGFSAMFWPALALTPIVFYVVVRFSTGRV